MRIAIDTQSTFGRKTGIGIYTTQLLQALRQVALQHEYIELDWGHDPIMRLDRRLRWQQYEVPRRAHAAHAELLHVPGFDAPLWRRCPVVLTVHDLIGMLFPNNLPPIARFYWAAWLPFSARSATHIIADSEHTRNDIIRLLRIPEGRVTVVPLAADTRYQPIEEASVLQAIRTQYHLPSHFILFVSTIEPRKGLDILVEAYAQFHPTHQETQLVITGKRGWYTDQLFAQIRRLGLTDRILFTDYVPDQDMPALYNCAQAFAFPSRYEGFGLTVLEAMACGTPVVCSNSSSLPEVAGDAALMIPPNDPQALAQALGKVIESETLRQQMREKSLAQASRFTWEQTARKTLDVYEQVLRQEQDHAHRH